MGHKLEECESFWCEIAGSCVTSRLDSDTTLHSKEAASNFHLKTHTLLLHTQPFTAPTVTLTLDFFLYCFVCLCVILNILCSKGSLVIHSQFV